MKNFIKWFVRLIACLVFVVIIFQIAIFMSTGYIPFSYYLNTAIDEVILLGIVTSSFIASIITLFCSFQRVKMKICVIFILIPVILSMIFTYRIMNYIPPHQDDFFITELKASSKEECFKNVYCGTKEEISDSVSDPNIIRVACDYDDHCKPPIFLKNPNKVSKCLGSYWEWECSNGKCQCLHSSTLWDCFFADCP